MEHTLADPGLDQRAGARQRRTRERILFGGQEHLTGHLLNGRWALAQGKLLDISGGGAQVELCGPWALDDLPAVDRISIRQAGQVIGNAAVKQVRLIQPPDAERGARVSAVFAAARDDFFIPVCYLRHVERSTFRLRAGAPVAAIVGSILHATDSYRSRRQGCRVRLPREWSITVRGADEQGAPGQVWGTLADISAGGLGFYAAPRADAAPWQQGARILIEHRGEALGQRPVHGLYERTCLVRGEPGRRVGVTFREVIGHCTWERFYAEFNRAFGMLRPPAEQDALQLIRSLLAGEEDLRLTWHAGAAAPEDLYRFRYRIYRRAGKVEAEDYPEGRLQDAYDDVGQHLVVRVRGAIVAAARVVSERAVPRFDLELQLGRSLRVPGIETLEVSRFCIDPTFRRGTNGELDLFLKLSLGLFRWALTHGHMRLVITAQQAHVWMYEKLGFRSVGNYFRLAGFNYDYILLELNLNQFEEVISPDLLPHFLKARRDVKGE